MRTTRHEATMAPRLHPSAQCEKPPADNECVLATPAETVHIISQDLQTRDSITKLLAALSLKVTAFESAANYFEHGPEEPGCRIVDLQLPNDDASDLQRRTDGKIPAPTIFVSDHRDVPAAVRAMKGGAIDILTKPVNQAALASAVHEALAQSRRLRIRMAELATLRQRYFLLTPREREVLPLIIGGLLNKQAASVLGISEVTLQIHRSQVMQKMNAKSFPDLVRMGLKLRIPHWRGVHNASGPAAKLDLGRRSEQLVG